MDCGKLNRSKYGEKEGLKMTDCIFCKIIDKSIPSRIIFENDDVVAFLDSSQATPGHTLLVPRKHVKDITEYDADLAGRVFSYLPQLARAVMNYEEGIQGINILNNNGETAYQSVFHSHIHLIPRWSEEDGFKIDMANNAEAMSDEKLDELAKNIKTALKDEE